MFRRTRFVCVSDTHNSSPYTGAFKLPKGDVLIHAGDLTKQGTLHELQKAVDWIEKADFEAKIVIAGNHDITLDRDFYAQYMHDFHNQDPQSHEECVNLLRDAPSIIYLENEAVEVKLCKDSGPRTHFRVFGSPNSVRKRTWAFQHNDEEAPAIWSRMPLNTDIAVLHGPPKNHCDEWEGREGCEVLRQALWRVRPRLAICGHIHNARGAERIRWDITNPNVRFKEESVNFWQDPAAGTKKQSLLDLSTRGANPLQNDGSHPREDIDMGGMSTSADVKRGHAVVTSLPVDTTLSSVGMTGLSTGSGFGCSTASEGSDVHALQGRMGRLETCVVNACIMASSYPYKGSGGERYNRPIVVDIDLPMWET